MTSRLVVIAMLMGLTSGLVACDKVNNLSDVPDKMDSTNDKMDKMKGGIDKTADAIHLQILDNAWKNMLEKQNTLVPDNPIAIAVDARKFADEVTATELPEFTKAKLLEIRTVQPDDSTKVCDDESKPETCHQPADLMPSLMHKARAIVTALQAIWMQVEQKKIEQIVREQIPHGKVSGGSFETWVYPALALRAVGINGWMWTADLHDTMNNINNLRDAVKLADAVDFIVRAPYASKVSLTVTLPDLKTTLSYSVDQSHGVDPKQFWTEIQTAINSPNFDKGQNAADVADFNRLKEKVDAKVKRWK